MLVMSNNEREKGAGWAVFKTEEKWMLKEGKNDDDDDNDGELCESGKRK